ncbi:MAG: hypothetical protein ACFB00_13300 [Parvularculaceae bacterium]
MQRIFLIATLLVLASATARAAVVFDPVAGPFVFTATPSAGLQAAEDPGSTRAQIPALELGLDLNETFAIVIVNGAPTLVDALAQPAATEETPVAQTPLPAAAALIGAGLAALALAGRRRQRR